MTKYNMQAAQEPKMESRSGEPEVRKVQPSKGSSVLVNPRQTGNPVLKCIRNVPWEFADIIPDYVMGRTTCVLFLSLRYHQLHPDYIHVRLKELGRQYELRILLLQVDIKDPHHYVKELAKIAILVDCTLMLAWSPEEAGRYLETYKAFESKPPDMIMERTDNNYMAQLTDCLTSIKKVSKTDAQTLLSTFGSLEKIVKTSKDDLSLCPGVGPQKAQRLYDMFHEPFLKANKQKTETGSR
ncbi:PREDICTED: DNA excision repair protein ERCC-1-like [Priapulus caudatus]|uniref:DNA excision repair protein ERCC-1-like n=1 Tax=Priapulus caudatus TaxID=37621 RepID=A0ABM1E9E8_PRICU|nr:PREDICTED: DNA excision repair protein ERCC-1-like [Priapulus caudatus]